MGGFERIHGMAGMLVVGVAGKYNGSPLSFIPFALLRRKFQMPATIDDPAILTEIAAALGEIGYR